MMPLPYPEPMPAPTKPSRARALKAMELRAQGMTDKAIAAQMMSELPYGSRLVITPDDIWRWCRETGERSAWSGAI